MQVCDALILPQPDKLSGLQKSTYEKGCLIDGLLNIGSTCVTHASPFPFLLALTPQAQTLETKCSRGASPGRKVFPAEVPSRGGGAPVGGWRKGGVGAATLRLTSSAAAGSVHPASGPMAPASGTICRASSTGRECAPSPWAVATPWSRGPAPWGAGAEARPHLDSAWGPHGQPQGPARPLPGEVPSRGLPGPAESPRGVSSQTQEASLGGVCYTWQSWDSATKLPGQDLSSWETQEP